MTTTHVQRTFRIGVQTLTQEGDRFFVSIRNRTYASRVEITREKARIWYRLLKS